MPKHTGSCITLLLLPGILFAVIFFGATFFITPEAATPTPEEQQTSTMTTPSPLCGNGVCEKNERDEHSCEEDC